MQKKFLGQSLLSLPVSIRMKGVQLVGFFKTCAALAGDGGRRSHMNYSLNSSRLDGGVGLLSSRVVYNTAYAGDVCRLLEGEVPWKCGVRFDFGRKSTIHSRNTRQRISIGTPRLGLQLFEH